MSCFRKCTYRPRRYKLNEVMDIIMNSNDSENEKRYTAVVDEMARNRFQKLVTILHIANNLALGDDNKATDRACKLRHWLEAFRRNCLNVVPDEINSIDEIMVPYKGRTSGIKQYMRSKPHPSGFKIWTSTRVSGMFYDFDVYHDVYARNEYGMSDQHLQRDRTTK